MPTTASLSDSQCMFYQVRNSVPYVVTNDASSYVNTFPSNPIGAWVKVRMKQSDWVLYTPAWCVACDDRMQIVERIWWKEVLVRLEKLTFIVRETGVSRYNEGSIKAPLKPLNTIVLRFIGGLRGYLNWGPMMPRDPSLSDSYTSKVKNSPT